MKYLFRRGSATASPCVPACARISSVMFKAFLWSHINDKTKKCVFFWLIKMGRSALTSASSTPSKEIMKNFAPVATHPSQVAHLLVLP